MRILRIEPSVEDASGTVADRDELQRAFRTLSVEHRTIAVLHFYVGMSTADAAATLGIPTGTAKSRLHYAMEALRASLASNLRDEIHDEASA